MSSAAQIVLIALGAWLLFWMFASFVLRWGGAMLGLGALVATAAGDGAVMLLFLAPALVAWVVGHWLYYLSHGYYKSELVDSVASDLPGYNPLERIRVHFD